jgi:hypothetical protein
LPGLVQQVTIAGAKQAVVAHLDEPRWQHVLEEAADKLFNRQRAALNLIGGRLFVGESDVAILELAQTVVADSDAKDVRGEIFEGLFATADGLAVNYPALFPNSLSPKCARFSAASDCHATKFV